MWRRFEWIQSVTAVKGKHMNPSTRACVSLCMCARAGNCAMMRARLTLTLYQEGVALW